VARTDRHIREVRQRIELFRNRFTDVMRLIEAQEDPPPGDYVTLAGFLLWKLQILPKSGDHVTWAGWRFEVVDMDGRRIDMALAQRRPKA
jgi:CBS domain containing-hemolysin-like protein